MLLLIVPLAAGLLCFATNSRSRWERLNLGAFAVVAGLSFKVAGDVAASGTVTALGGFLRADALSALLKKAVSVEIRLELGCRELEPAPSAG